MTITDTHLSPYAQPDGPSLAVMPDVPRPDSAVWEITALDALHFGWHAEIMDRVEEGLAFMGGLLYAPDGRELAALRAYVTATDERIGRGPFTWKKDPMGFAFVAREVTELSTDELLTRYTDRRCELTGGRYQFRDVMTLPRGEKERIGGLYDGAADNEEASGRTERAGERRRTGQSIRNGWGWMVWDRLNHAYLVTLWFNNPEDAAARAGELNRRHQGRTTLV